MSDNPFIHSTEPKKANVFKQVFEALVIAITVNVVIYFLFIIPSQVDGPSMLPNLVDKELLFANKTPTWFNNNTDTLKKFNWDYERGDVVIFDFENIVLVKRIIAKPGDEIYFEGGDVFVNGKKLYETYLPVDTKTYLPQAQIRFLDEGQKLIVPEDNYIVLGDNRSQSKDSRYQEVGLVKREMLKGIIFFRLWPLNKLGAIPRGAYKEQ